MIQVLETYNEETGFNKNVHRFIEKYPEEVIKQIDRHFEGITTNFTEEKISFLFDIYNAVFHNAIAAYVLERSFQLFCDTISEMLQREMYYGILSLLDLFWHNWDGINWTITSRNLLFLKNTYPLLFCTDDFAEIAARFYWDLIADPARYNSENITIINTFWKLHAERYNHLFPFAKNEG